MTVQKASGFVQEEDSDNDSMASACEVFEPVDNNTDLKFDAQEQSLDVNTAINSAVKLSGVTTNVSDEEISVQTVHTFRPERLNSLLKLLTVSSCLGTGQVQLSSPFDGLRYTSATVEANRKKNAKPLVPISKLPEEVRSRFEKWTTNKRQFSTNVIKHAKVKPLSHSYELGVVSSPGGGIGFGGGATPSDNLEVAGPENMMKLIWHKSWTGAKLSENENSDIIKVPAGLSVVYAQQLLRDISAIIQFDADFKSEPERFPGLKQLFDQQQ